MAQSALTVTTPNPDAADEHGLHRHDRAEPAELPAQHLRQPVQPRRQQGAAVALRREPESAAVFR